MCVLINVLYSKTPPPVQYICLSFYVHYFCFLYCFYLSSYSFYSNVLMATNCLSVCFSKVFDQTGTEPLPRCLSINCFNFIRPVQYISVRDWQPCCCLIDRFPEGTGVTESLFQRSGIHCRTLFSYASDFSHSVYLGARGCVWLPNYGVSRRDFFLPTWANKAYELKGKLKNLNCGKLLAGARSGSVGWQKESLCNCHNIKGGLTRT